MSAEEIIEEIEKQGNLSLKAIQDECSKNLKEMTEKYNREVKQLREESERRLSEHLMRMEVTFNDEMVIGKKTVFHARSREVLDSFWEQLAESTDKVRSDKRYLAFMLKAIGESQSKLGKKLTIYSSPKDKEIVENIEGEFKFVGWDREDLGLIAISNDGSRSLNISLNSIIDEARDSVESELLNELGVR